MLFSKIIDESVPQKLLHIPLYRQSSCIVHTIDKPIRKREKQLSLPSKT